MSSRIFNIADFYFVAWEFRCCGIVRYCVKDMGG
jgi:hypothetical protein